MFPLHRDPFGQPQAITLTGWSALAGIAALVLLVGWGGYQGYRKYRGMGDHDYTLVVKNKHSGGAHH